MFVYLTASSERRIICHSLTEVAIQCFDDFCDNDDWRQQMSGSTMFNEPNTFTLNKITLFHQKYWNNKINRVVFTLDYNEHRYAAPWAVRSNLGDDHSFSAQA